MTYKFQFFPGYKTPFDVDLLWRYGFGFWWFMFKMNCKSWWKIHFLWFFKFHYYMATDKAFRRLQREMKEYQCKLPKNKR